MILDNTTFERVAKLLKIPCNYVEYNGAWQLDVAFFIGVKNDNGDMVSGVHVIVTQDFKIKRIERIRVTWGRYSRKRPTVTDILPLHPKGAIHRIGYTA